MTCFPSASALRICYQSAPAERSRCLKLQPLDYATIPVILFSPLAPSVLFVSRLCHMDVMADESELMHVESMAHTQALTKLPPTHMSVALLRFQTVMFLLFTEGGISHVFMLETGLGCDV